MVEVVLVALDLHNDTPCQYVDESDPRVVGGNHADIRVEEVDASHLPPTRELAAVVSHFNRLLELELLSRP